MIGHGLVIFVAQMNNSVVLFVEKMEQADLLMGLNIGGTFEEALPLSQPTNKATLLNVPLFISYDLFCAWNYPGSRI